ncbi:hypothetical protein GCM10010174_26000 [Kutzneria viridogrisea]|uniref:Zinc-ribbon domain-containing protein n=1 Tax=Kutzneria viridogrisea TaxID=47990 RepID=A0ABR6BRI2_9PSEU|nr:hypothetical protein [Kutzneria viridogrisea]
MNPLLELLGELLVLGTEFRHWVRTGRWCQHTNAGPWSAVPGLRGTVRACPGCGRWEQRR